MVTGQPSQVALGVAGTISDGLQPKSDGLHPTSSKDGFNGDPNGPVSAPVVHSETEVSSPITQHGSSNEGTFQVQMWYPGFQC